MFNRILIPVDLSQKNQRVIDLAAGMVKPHGGEIYLIHVIETLDPSLDAEMEPFYQRLEQNSRNHLTELGETLTKRNVEWEAEVLFGQRGTDILRRAQELEVDLIALHSHPIDRSEPNRGWTTLSYQIGIFADCPVLLVK